MPHLKELELKLLFIKCTCISLITILNISCESSQSSSIKIFKDYAETYNARTSELNSLVDFANDLHETHDNIVDSFDASDGLSPEEGEVVALFFNPNLRLSRLESESAKTIVNDEWNTRSTIRSKWASWFTAEENIKLIKETIKNLEEIDLIAKSLRNSDELNRIQYRLIDIEVKNKRIELDQLSQIALKRKNELLLLLGLPPTSSDLLQKRSPIVMVPYIQNATQRMIEANTELAIKIAARKKASTPFQFDVAEANIQSTFAQLSLELSEAYESLELIKAQRSLVEKDIIPTLRDQINDLEAIAELGELDIFVFLETTKKYYQANKKLLELNLSSIQAANKVCRLLGPHSQQKPSPVGGLQ